MDSGFLGKRSFYQFSYASERNLVIDTGCNDFVARNAQIDLVALLAHGSPRC